MEQEILKQLKIWKRQAKKNAQRYFKEAMPISESAALSEIQTLERVENYILRNLEK